MTFAHDTPGWYKYKGQLHDRETTVEAGPNKRNYTQDQGKDRHLSWGSLQQRSHPDYTLHKHTVPLIHLRSCDMTPLPRLRESHKTGFTWNTACQQSRSVQMQLHTKLTLLAHRCLRRVARYKLSLWKQRGVPQNHKPRPQGSSRALSTEPSKTSNASA
jgi:hypothetical protein